MISVGDSDGRKRLGFSAEGAMEETELEEGEACSYQNYDYNSTIDPDVALSYIDEKLQDVLGHFQKDFEGGVSAENLGAKFGGYGSFLPAYQRSPLLSRPRTPQKVHSCNAPKSHNNLHQEEGPNNSLVPSNTSLVMSKGSSSAPSVSLNPFRDSANVSSKRNERISSAYHAEESRSRCELDQSCSQASERTLRVRIKVGSDNLSTRKNAEIYSGLGLDISPSSSPDGSPIDSEGSREPFNAPEESPTSILQIMTSFPVHSNLLLSPLPDYLIYLNEKQKSWGENRFTSSQQVSKGSLSAKQGDKVKGGHKPKSLRKNGFPMEPKNHSAKDSQKGSGVLLKKEENVYRLECEGLADDPRVANKLKRESSLDLGKGETLEAASIGEIGLVDKPSGKNASAGKVFEEETVNFPNDISVYLRKDGNFNGEKTSDLSTADSNVSYEKKARNTELCDLSELKMSKKATSLEEDGMKLASVKDHAVAGSKKKSKGSRSQVVHSTEVAKDSSIMDYSLMPKGRNRTHTDNIFSKGELEDSKIQKGLAKARNTYRDFFGDIELEQEDNNVDSEEMILTNRQDFGASASDITSKEKLDVKKMDKPSIPEAYSKAALAATPIKGNGPISEAVAGSSVPLVKEDWVCCDKCQKWRLLPLGTNPDSLPEKWLCSMLDWLSGMNRCSVSEEETTKAIVALHQLPAPGGGLPVSSLADASCFDQKPQNLGFHAVSAGGKKKHGVKDVSALTNQDGPANISNSEKNLQASVKCGSFNDVNLPPLISEIETQHLSKSSVVEKHRSKQKGKKKVLEEHSGRGEIKSSVKGSKRDIDLDWPSVSKKAKVDTEHSIDDDWICDRDEPLRKVGPSSASGLSLNASGKDRHKNDDLLTRQRKRDTSNSSRGSLRNSNGYGTEKKRKKYESQDKHVNSSPVLSGHRLLGRSDFLEVASKNDHGKEKKARISKSERKETSFSKGSGGPRKSKNIKDQKFGQDLESKLTQRNLDAMDSLKRDLGSGQPSQATSSSSKVSGSHKSRTRSKKVKGSPVESVSSSPLRFLNQDKSASIRRSLEGKDDFGDVALFTTGNPRRCSDGEDEGESDDFGTVRKDETFAMHRGSMDSSGLDFQGRDSGHIAGSGDKIKLLQSPEIGNCHFADGSADMVHLGNQHPIKPQNSYQCSNEEQGTEKQYYTNESCLRKTGQGSSSRSKDKNGTLTELDKGELKAYDFCDESIVHAPFGEKPRAQKNSVQERAGIGFHNAEQDMLIGKDEFKVVGENNKRDGQFKYRGDNSMDGKLDASSLDPKQNLWLDRDEILSKELLSDPEHVEVSRRGKSHQLPSCSRGQSEIEAHSLHLVAGSQKENEAKSSLTDASRGDDTLKAPKPARRSENQNGNQHTKLRHHTPNGQRVKGVDAPSPARRDPSSQTGNSAMKEATDLKHLADRLKNSGSSAESTSLYFQAALKFLHGASLLESCHSETAKKGEMIMSMQVYSSTAKLCEFCAHEYEKSKDMAAAALAYKLMEVAYMRVIYSSHTSVSKDRTALQIVPLGESPSSSASDVDSLNNPTTLDKGLLGKGVSSPQVAGNHIIAARNRPNLVRLLKFAQDMNYAMEASRKSRNAFAAANPKAEEAQCREGISSIKKALDFSFQDVEGLLRLVRLAMDAISR